jgi:hypothetical protein
MGFIPHWTAALEKPETNDAFSRKMVETPKVVFTKTIENNPWDNTQLATGSLKEEINKLKSLEGKKRHDHLRWCFIGRRIDRRTADR